MYQATAAFSDTKEGNYIVRKFNVVSNVFIDESYNFTVLPDDIVYFNKDYKVHRLEGPAIYNEYNAYCPYWFYNGKQITGDTQEEFERLIKLAILW